MLHSFVLSAGATIARKRIENWNRSLLFKQWWSSFLWREGGGWRSTVLPLILIALKTYLLDTGISHQYFPKITCIPFLFLPKYRLTSDLFLLPWQLWLPYMPAGIRDVTKRSTNRKPQIGLKVPLFRRIVFALFVPTSYKLSYLHCGQPYTSTLIEMCPFHSCGLNLRYMASNTLTSLRTTVSWSVLPVRICCLRLKW